jgi:STE24 endopeptidase
MVYVAVILSLMLARWSDLVGPAPLDHGIALPTLSWWSIPWICSIGACLMVQGVAMVAGSALDKTGRVRWVSWVYRARTLAIGIALLGLAVGILMGGFDRAMRSVLGDVVLLDDLLIASPVLLTLICSWWSVFPIERRLREAVLLRTLSTGNPIHPLPTRSHFVLSHVRHGLMLVLLPTCLMITWTDCVVRAPTWLTGTDLAEPAQRWAGLAHWVGVLVMIVIAPGLLRIVWDVQALADGPLRQHIRSACDAAHVRVRGPMVWRTGGTLVNGAILGVLWPFRYLLFTDAMLERLSATQLDAVLAHEMAHVRYRHMLWLGVVAGGAILAIGWAAEWLAGHLDSVHAQSSTTLLLATVATMGGGILVFGAASRRFEWQADAFSARWLALREGHSVMPQEAAETVAGTLGAVAEHNGVPPSAFSWRHGSIATRQARVRALVGCQLDALPIDRQSFWIRWLGAAVLLLGVVGLWLQK